MRLVGLELATQDCPCQQKIGRTGDVLRLISEKDGSGGRAGVGGWGLSKGFFFWFQGERGSQRGEWHVSKCCISLERCASWHSTHSMIFTQMESSA
jgi:hypothetical protein